MSFSSKSQWRAAFGGHLGSDMKAKASEWAHKSPSYKSLPTKSKKDVLKKVLKKHVKKHDGKGGRTDVGNLGKFTPSAVDLNPLPRFATYKKGKRRFFNTDIQPAWRCPRDERTKRA